MLRKGGGEGEQGLLSEGPSYGASSVTHQQGPWVNLVTLLVSRLRKGVGAGTRSHLKAQLEKLLLPKSWACWQCPSLAAEGPSVSVSCQLLAGGHPWCVPCGPSPWSAHRASESESVLARQMLRSMRRHHV